MSKKVLSVLVASSLLSACGVTQQDTGDGSSGTVSGRSVDGYLASAVVFVDTNENGILEAWEPRALTDKDGFFSYSTKGAGTNYCDLPETDKDAVHCLRTPPGSSEVLLRVVNGYDVTTGEPFVGTMTLRTQAGGDITRPAVASPISSILSHMTETAQANFAALYTLSLDDLKSDILDDLNEIDETTLPGDVDEQERRTKLSIAIQAHKLSDIMASYLESLFVAENGTDPLFGTEPAFAGDATSYIYQAVAEQLIASPVTINNFFADSSKVWNTIIAARDAINEEIRLENVKRAEDGDIELLEDSSISGATEENIAARLVETASFIDSLLSSTTNTSGLIDSEDIESKLRAVEIVTTVLRDPAKSNLAPMDTGAQRAIDLALGNGLDNVTYLTNMKSAKTDLQSLVAKFNDPATAGTVAETDADFASRQTLETQIAGGTLGTDEVQLNMTNSDAGSTDAANMTFNPDGSMNVQMDFTDSSGDNPLNVTSEDTLSGTWEAVNDYTMVANIEVAGVNQPVIIRTNSDGSGYVFDYGGEANEWTQSP